MSVFNPASITGQPDQKKMLLERLMQQYQDMAGRAAGLQHAQSSLGGVVGGTPFHAVHPFGGVGLVTALAHGLPADLIARLGPGAIGTPAPGHTGNGVTSGGPPIGNPHGGGNPAAGGPPGGGSPIPAVGGPGAFQGAVAALQQLTPNGAGAGAGLGSKTAAINEIIQRRPNIYNTPFHSFGMGMI